MECTLCGNAIDNYDPEFHHLPINESRSAEICQGCLDKIVDWQGRIAAKLFPTTNLKKRWGSKKPK